MRDKYGYTLLEMLLVLVILSILFLLVPSKQLYEHYVLRQKVDYVKAMLLKNQSMALSQHKERAIIVQTDAIVCEEQTIPLSPLECSGPSFHYTPTGSISQALTLHFTYGLQQYDLVLQLGSGCVDVR